MSGPRDEEAVMKEIKKSVSPSGDLVLRAANTPARGWEHLRPGRECGECRGPAS